MPIGLYFTVNKSWVKEHERHGKNGRIVAVKRYWRDDHRALGHGTWETLGLPSWPELYARYGAPTIPLLDLSGDHMGNGLQLMRMMSRWHGHWDLLADGVRIQDALGDSVDFLDRTLTHLDIDHPKDPRFRYMPWIFHTLVRPVEVWRHRVSKQKRLGRVYLGLIQQPGRPRAKTMAVLAAVEDGRLIGWTVFPMDIREARKFRYGALLYRRY